MSDSIDNKVVEMDFDNSNFESNVAVSMNTLDKLKKAVDIKDAGKGLTAIGDAASRIDMSGLTNGVANLSSGFNALEAVALGAFMRIGAGAVDLGARLLRALTVQPLIDGFNEYEMTMNSVKTIQANLPNESMESINSTLAALNKYADDTIYSFSDMTRAIGQFTAAGVDLNSATLAIKGMSNVAAGAGANNQALARAEYQVSQALQSGVFHLMDWNSLVQAGMANPELQEQLKATARAHGIAVDEIIKKDGSFRDSLKDEWLTADIFTETMARAADTTNEWGARLTDAATQVNTFTQLVSVLAESMGSGFTQTWQIILGDYQQSKAIFTGLYNELNPLIDGMGNFRNGILQTWADLGGRDYLFDGIIKGLQGIINLFTPLSDGLAKIFGGSGSVLASASKAFDDLMTKFADGTSVLVSNISGVTAPVQDALGQIFGEGGIRAVTDKMSEFHDALAGGFSDTATKVADSIGGVTNQVNSFASGLGDKLQPITDKIHNLGDTLSQAFDGTTFHSEAINNFIAAITRQNEGLTGAQRAALNFKMAIQGAVSLVDIFAQALGVVNTVLNRSLEVIARLAGSAGKVIVAIAGGIGSLITTIDELLNGDNVFGKATDAVNGFFDALNDPLNAIDAFADVVANVITTVFEVLGNVLRSYVAPALKEFGQLIQPIITALGALFGALWQLAGSALGKLPELFIAAANAVYDFFKSLSFNVDFSSFQGIISTIQSFAQALWSKLAPAFSVVADKIGEFAKFAGGVLKTGFDVFMKYLPGVVDWLGRFAGILGSAALTGLKALGGGLLAVGQAIGSTIGAIASSSADAVTSGQLFTGAAGAFAKAVPVIANALTALRNIIVRGAKAIGLADFVNGIADGIKNFNIGVIFAAIGDFLGRIGQTIVRAITSFSLGDMIRSAFANLIIPAFRGLGEVFGTALGFVTDSGSSIVAGLVDAFGALRDGIVDALDAFLTGLNPSFEGGVKTFTSMLEKLFGGFFTGTANIVKMVVSGGGNTLGAALEDMQKNGAFVSIIRIIDTLSGLYLAKSLSNATSAMDTAAEMGKHLTKAIDRFAKAMQNISKAAKYIGMAAIFVSLAWSVRQIADSIAELGQLDLGTLAQGGVAVLAIVGVLVGIAAVIAKLHQSLSVINTVAPEMNDNPIAKFIMSIKNITSGFAGVGAGVKLGAIALMIGALGLVVKLLADTAVKLGQMDTGTLVKGLGTLLGIIGTIATVYSAILIVADKFKSGAAAIALMGAGIALIALAFAGISKTLQSNDMGTTVGALGIILGCVGVLTAISIVLSKFAGPASGLLAAGSVVLLCGSLLLVANAFKTLSDTIRGMDQSDVNTTEQIILRILAVLTVCDVAISKLAGGASGLAAAASMVVLAYALGRVCDAINTIQDPEKASKVIESMDGLLLVIGLLIAVLGKMATSAITSIAIAASIAAVIVAMGWLVEQISDIDDPSGAVSVINALTILVGVIEALLIPFAALGVSSLGALAAAASVGLIMVAMGYLVDQIGSISDPSGASQVLNSLAILGGIIGGVLAIFAALGPLSLATIPAAASIAGVLVVMGGLVEQIGQIQDPSGAADVIQSLALLAGVLAGALVVWGAIAGLIPMASTAASSLGQLFIDIATAMDSGASAISKTADAMNNLSPVMDQMENLDPSAVDNLADICGILAGIDLVGALAGFISDNDTIGNVCRGLGTLAGTLDQWAADDYTTAAENMQSTLGAVGAGLTNFGSVLAGWANSGDDIENVLNGLSNLSQGISAWGDSDIDYDAVANNIRSVSGAVGDVAGSLSGIDGSVGETLAIIGPQLVVLAAGASAWGSVDPSVGDTMQGVMLAISTAVMSFADASDAIMNLPLIGAGISSLASGLVAFAVVDAGIADTLTLVLTALSVNLPGLAAGGDSIMILTMLGPALSSLASGCSAFTSADPATTAYGLTLLAAALGSFGDSSESFGGIAMALSDTAYACSMLSGSASEAATGLSSLSEACNMVGSAAAYAAGLANASFAMLTAQAYAASAGVVSAMYAMNSGVGAAMSGMTSTIAGAMSSAVSMMTTGGIQAGAGFSSGIYSTVGSAASAAYACVSAAAAAFSNTSGSYSAGVQFAQGYRNGIMSQVSSIASAASQMVSAAISAAKSAQASASPSRVMKRVGRWYAQGYAIGIREDADQAVQESAAMVKNAIDAASNMSDSPSFVSPMISPVFDSQKLQNGIDSAALQMNTIMNSAISYSNADVVDAVNGLRDDLDSYTTEMKNSRMATINIDKEALNTHPDVEADVLNILDELSTLGAMNRG